MPDNTRLAKKLISILCTATMRNCVIPSVDKKDFSTSLKMTRPHIFEIVDKIKVGLKVRFEIVDKIKKFCEDF